MTLYQKKLILAILAFIGALILNYYASRYTLKVGQLSCSVNTDLLLNILPYYNDVFLFVWGFFAFVIIVVLNELFFAREQLPYIFWMYAAFITLRCFFVILTPLNTPPDDGVIPNDFLYNHLGVYLTAHYDLFFSSHTSMPFLGFLIIKQPITRFLLLGFSILLASVVLLGRYHYSIDVFAAFFVTYAFVQFHRNIIEPRFERWLNKTTMISTR